LRSPLDEKESLPKTVRIKIPLVAPLIKIPKKAKTPTPIQAIVTTKLREKQLPKLQITKEIKNNSLIF
jgi:hypothetical protein